MLKNKIVYFEEIYKFSCKHFSIKVISFVLYIKNVFMNNKNLIFPPNYMSYEKTLNSEIVCLTKVYKFTFRLFLYLIASLRFNCKKR